MLIKGKKKEEYLSGPDEEVTETKDMLLMATNFYKNLFGYEEKLDIHLSEYFLEVWEKVSNEETDMLSAPFSEEVRQAIFCSYAYGAKG